MKALWAGLYKCISPRDFKNTIGKINDQFAGYDQQDSQELLLFLMDGLHEDLNKVEHKLILDTGNGLWFGLWKEKKTENVNRKMSQQQLKQQKIYFVSLPGTGLKCVFCSFCIYFFVFFTESHFDDNLEIIIIIFKQKKKILK